MKKQINEKSTKKNLNSKNSPLNSKKTLDQKNKKEGGKSSSEDEISDEEKLENAKKDSKNKAANFNQSAMIKKLILQNLAKYTLIVAIFSLVTIGIIQSGPAIFGFLSGLISKFLMSALNN
jgi:hypothetical protein